jgi:hypothetical protein
MVRRNRHLQKSAVAVRGVSPRFYTFNPPRPR